jgi:hypothetical protein
MYACVHMDMHLCIIHARICISQHTQPLTPTTPPPHTHTSSTRLNSTTATSIDIRFPLPPPLPLPPPATNKPPFPHAATARRILISEHVTSQFVAAATKPVAAQGGGVTRCCAISVIGECSLGGLAPESGVGHAGRGDL